MGQRKFDTKIDGATRRVLRNTYPKGARVEAVKVDKVAIGTKGVVREVKDNGDVSVIWVNGDITDVQYGRESIRTIVDSQCLLGKAVEKGGCDGKSCKTCGWNASVHRKRVGRIKRGDWSVLPNGIKTLVVGGEEGSYFPE